MNKVNSVLMEIEMCKKRLKELEENPPQIEAEKIKMVADNLLRKYKPIITELLLSEKYLNIEEGSYPNHAKGIPDFISSVISEGCKCMAFSIDEECFHLLVEPREIIREGLSGCGGLFDKYYVAQYTCPCSAKFSRVTGTESGFTVFEEIECENDGHTYCTDGTESTSGEVPARISKTINWLIFRPRSQMFDN